MTIPTLTIPESAWASCCDLYDDKDGHDDDGRCRLHTHVEICGVSYYVEAVRVRTDCPNEQAAACDDGQRRLDSIGGEFETATFQTCQIGGRDYVLFLCASEA